MISILIPEHNYDCTKLVNDLSVQCQKSGLQYEILVMDDASTHFKTENRTISSLTSCLFIESNKNSGSTKTRNNLARRAKYPYILIVDCDMEVRDDQYIQRYVDAMGKAPVVVGGTIYTDLKPDMNHLLRWQYGRNRETISATVRNQNPWKAISTPNLMMEKSIFEKFPFDELFTDYGHEDTIWGFTLKQNQIPILHIDNPLIHNGLDINEIFLAKSIKAVEKYVTVPLLQTDEAVEDIKIFRVYKRVKSLGLCGLLALKFRVANKLMQCNLSGRYPSLFIYDFYRLSYLCNYCLKHQNQSKIQ